MYAHLAARGGRRAVDDDAVDGGGGAVVHLPRRPRPRRRRVDAAVVVRRGEVTVLVVVGMVGMHVPAAALHDDCEEAAAIDLRGCLEAAGASEGCCWSS